MEATCAPRRSLLEKGVPIATVSALLGHSSVLVTEQRYARVTARMKNQAIEVVTKAYAELEQAADEFAAGEGT